MQQLPASMWPRKIRTFTTGNLMSVVCPTVCRVQVPEHKANMSFAECAKKIHGKTKTHGKIMVCRVLFYAHGKEILCRVFFWHTAKHDFAVCFILAHGKVINFFCLLTSKLFLLFTYNMWHFMLKFGIFLYLFVIFN